MREIAYKKGMMVFGIISLFIGVGAVPSISSSENLIGDIIIVPDDYPTIQEAIDNAKDDDTIFVYSGTYYENVVVDKAITLLGEEKETTIIDGNKSGDVIYISADWVSISGFTIKNSGNRSGESGVEIYSNYTTLSDNNLSNNQYGIYLRYSDGNNISKNNISMNSQYGVYVYASSDANIVSDNIISGSEYGIRIKGSRNNNVFANTICNNERGIYLCCGARHNKIYHNTFQQNSEWNANDSLNNTWDNGYPSGGNYWDDYNGTDADGDGIGDTPYIIDGAGNKDNYPLITPYENHSPNKPSRPTGETSGKSGEEYTYTTTTYDPDGDQVWYKWDWGDEISGWDGPYDSGDTVDASHVWDEKDDYNIKVKAKDVHGEESPWSDPLPIKTPKNKVINTPFIRYLENHPHIFPVLKYILAL